MQDEKAPWVEKYRPNSFENIVLDEMNREILINIIEKDEFPNLLLYGQPGTGKTTTIINLIKEYQRKRGYVDSKMMIHLNASDDRGIDIIRSQINNFVNTKPLFNTGIKFIILDEADYMTKNAQQALHILIENVQNDVRFCLICNYISKIDLSLQNEFIHMRFNILPKDKIRDFLGIIVKKEKLNVNSEKLNHIIRNYNNDIRSMINYMQVNQEKLHKIKVITNEVYENIDKNILKGGQSVTEKVVQINQIANSYYCKMPQLIKNYLKYKIFVENVHDEKLIKYCKLIMHNRYNRMMINRLCTNN